MVTTDAAGKERIQLSLSFNAVASIVVWPRPQIYLSAVEGQGGSARVVMHRPDGEVLKVTPSHTELPEHLQVKVYDVTENDSQEAKFDPKPGDVWVEVEVTEKGPATNTNTTLELLTNHPEVPRFRLPLVVRVKPLYDLRPSVVRLLPPGDGKDGTSAVVRISHAERKPFTIAGIESSHPEFFGAVAMSEEARPIQTVRIRPASDIDLASIDGKLRGILRIAVAGPSSDVVEVQVVVNQHRDKKNRGQERGSRKAIPTRTAPSPTEKGPG
jgi:hypothetical protein